MRRRWLSLAGIAAIALLIFFVSSDLMSASAAGHLPALAPETKEEVIVLPSGRRVWSIELVGPISPYGSWLAWIDENTLFIAGKHRQPSAEIPQAEAPVQAWAQQVSPTGNQIYRWRIGGELRLYAEGTGFCYDRITNFIYIWGVKKPSDPRSYVLSGMPSQEVEEVSAPPKRASTFDPFTCKRYDAPPWLRLRYEHGALRSADGPATRSIGRVAAPIPKPVFFHPADGRPPIEMPFLNHEAGPPIYSAFEEAYFRWDHRPHPFTRLPSPEGEMRNYDEDWARTNCRRAWWLWPDGRTREICLPYIYGADRFYPIRAGIVATANIQNSETDPGHAGVYLIADGRVERVLSGYIGSEGAPNINFEASPDGCRIAVGFAPDRASGLGYRGKPRVRVLDFCVSR